jgi:hypothetical protein
MDKVSPAPLFRKRKINTAAGNDPNPFENGLFRRALPSATAAASGE